MTCEQNRVYQCHRVIAWARIGALNSMPVALILTGLAPEVKAQRVETTSASLVFDEVTVIDVERGKLMPDQRVVIVGNRIKAMGSVGTVELPNDAKLVDAQGKYLIPGFWDMHVHPHYVKPAVDRAYPLFVANGVTGIRDAHFGFSKLALETAIHWRQEILAGHLVGPPRQLFVGLPFSDSVTYPCRRPGGVTCLSTASDAQRLVDSFAIAGADMIKTYGLSRMMYFAIAAEARRLGIPFGGHVGQHGSTVPAPSAIEASDSGARLIDHVPSSGGLDTLCLIRPLASLERCRPVAATFQHNNTWWVPTLIHGRLSPLRYHLQKFVKAFWESSGPLRYGFDSAAVQAVHRPHLDSLGLLRLIQQVKLPIVAGSDAVGFRSQGFLLHTELATYVSEGLTPLEALQTATINPAKMLRATDSLGTVAPGKLADLVLLDANPLADITNTTTIRAVVANGRYFDRAALDKLMVQVRAKEP